MAKFRDFVARQLPVTKVRRGHRGDYRNVSGDRQSLFGHFVTSVV
jgi:hypothetical protein